MQRTTIPFKILHIDSLGQGVSKEADKITFIPKTLAGETGFARVFEEKKGVAFAEVTELVTTSELRRPPPCRHFHACPSCHYLHTDYGQELAVKGESLRRLFQKLPHPPIEVVPAVRRLGYRNRIQLHYDLDEGKLGFFDRKQGRILEVPGCLIGEEAVLAELRRLYADARWRSEAPMNLRRGHVEIYHRPGDKCRLEWNQPYASGGFTQVFDEMNQVLKSRLLEMIRPLPELPVLDLFAGNGNLSAHLPQKRRLCVDLYSGATPGDDFLSQDLYGAPALGQVQKHLAKQSLAPGLIILDPPRSGLKNLSAWVEAFRPSYLAYVSCDPHTLVRDLIGCKGYEITKLLLIDFFPSTWHFETLVFLERKA